MNQADTAWMLSSTALVLLMTPALAFFYGGLVRSKNALNTMMMSFISLGFVGVAVGGHRLLAGVRAGQRLDRRSRRVLFLRGVGLEPQGHDPAPAVHVLPGDVRHHHGRADFRRDRRAHALLGVRDVHHAVVDRRLQPDRALGVGRRLARARWARSISPAARSCTSTPAVAALVAALVRRARGGTIRPSALLPHNVPFTLLGAGLLWFGWFGFNAGSALAANGIAALAFTTTMLAPAATLVVWTLLDIDAVGQADRGRLRDGDRRRPRRDHAGGRLHRSDERDRARRDRGDSRATSA